MNSLLVPKENASPGKLNIEQEIERMIDEHGTHVLRTSFIYLKDRKMAEDAFQEVFIKVYKKYDTFMNKSSEKTWIISITINVCKNLLRSSWFKRVLLFDKLEAENNFEGFEADIIKKDEDKQLFNEVISLPTKLKDVIILYYYQEFDTAEISKILEIPEGTVRSRLHRARETLKNKIAGRVDYIG